MRLAALPLALLASLSIAGAGAAEWKQSQASYSATRVMRSGGELVMSGTVYHDRGKERWEASNGGMTQVMIMRPDSKKLFMLMPQMNMAMTMPLDQAPNVPTPEAYIQSPPVEVGRETVGGEATTKLRADGQSPRGPYTMFFWVTDDGIVMRMEGQSAAGVFESHLEDLRRGPQDAALFELPPGVQAMPMNPAAMQQMMPGATQ